MDKDWTFAILSAGALLGYTTWKKWEYKSRVDRLMEDFNYEKDNLCGMHITPEEISVDVHAMRCCTPLQRIIATECAGELMKKHRLSMSSYNAAMDQLLHARIAALELPLNEEAEDASTKNEDA